MPQLFNEEPPRAPAPAAYRGRFLLDEAPLVVQPALAQMVGLEEAHFLQVVHDLARNPVADPHLDVRVETRHCEGRVWVKIPPSLLVDQRRGRLRFLSESALKRTIASCRQQQWLLVREMNEDKRDKSPWYAVDLDALARRETAFLERLESAGPAATLPAGAETAPTGEETAAGDEETRRTVPDRNEDIFAERRKAAGEVYNRFQALSAETRQAVVRYIDRTAPGIAAMVRRRGGLKKLRTGSATWVDYLEQVHYALPIVLKEHRMLPGLDRPAPGETAGVAEPGATDTAGADVTEIGDLDGLVAAIYIAPDKKTELHMELLARHIVRLAGEIRDGVFELDELDERRESLPLLDDEEWHAITAGVRQQIRQC